MLERSTPLRTAAIRSRESIIGNEPFCSQLWAFLSEPGLRAACSCRPAGYRRVSDCLLWVRPPGSALGRRLSHDCSAEWIPTGGGAALGLPPG
jgi:hypothetical protein